MLESSTYAPDSAGSVSVRTPATLSPTSVLPWILQAPSRLCRAETLGPEGICSMSSSASSSLPARPSMSTTHA
uniref:Uncharacterized protein n=1 Tax=Arundo donax TaxID=35708 RepID=A0A0A9GG30_ARUDO